MKKLIYVLIIALLSVSLSACQKGCEKAPVSESTEADVSVSETTESAGSTEETESESETGELTTEVESEEETESEPETTHGTMDIVIESQGQTEVEVTVTERETDGSESLITVLHITLSNGEKPVAKTSDIHYSIEVSSSTEETVLTITADEGYKFAPNAKLLVNDVDRSSKMTISDDSCTILYRISAWSPIV